MKNEILPRLWIGSWRDADNCRGDERFSVITVANETEKPGNAWFPITDPGEAPEDYVHFCSAVEKIDEDLQQAEGHVLVHCQSGINRSPSVVMSYLMRYRGLSTASAHNLIKTIRRHIKPCDRLIRMAQCAAVGAAAHELDNGNVDRSGFVDSLLTQEEAIVDELYREILGRPADQDGLSHYSAKLMTGAGKRSIRAVLMASDERRRKLASLRLPHDHIFGDHHL